MSCWAQCCTTVLLTHRGWSGVTRPPDGWGWSVSCSLCIYRAALAAAIDLSSGAVGVSLVCLIIVGICGQRGAGLYVIWHGPGLQWTFKVCGHLSFGPTSAATWQMPRNDTLLCNHVCLERTAQDFWVTLKPKLEIVKVFNIFWNKMKHSWQWQCSCNAGGRAQAHNFQGHKLQTHLLPSLKIACISPRGTAIPRNLSPVVLLEAMCW